MPTTKNLLERIEDFCGKWYDSLFGTDESSDRQGLTDAEKATYTWWFVANRVTTGMVITDQARCVVIAPVAWNRFIGMTLDVLLGQVSAHAVPIPGPHVKPR